MRSVRRHGRRCCRARRRSNSATAAPSWTSAPRAQPGDKGKYVELAREQTDHIFVILAEFGNQRHPDYPDQDTDPETPGPERFDGPLHNEIDQPDRTVDNSTSWKADYNRQHYEQLYFSDEKESLKTYYQYQSSGRYSVDGTVTDWVKVPYNEARYGRSDGFPCDDVVCDNTWELVRDAANAWVADQEAQGKTPGADHRDARRVRPVGPLRLRLRRRLQRARRVHRPLPDRALRRRPGRR